MRLFKKEVSPPFRAIKLYCLGEPANRETLVSSILEVVQSAFGALPVGYDIDGPYGIKKGTTVGLQTFKSKLAKNGHDKYYALSAETSRRFGFSLLLGARINRTIHSTFSELVIWYASDNYSISFLDLAEPLLEPFNAVCGFDIDIPDGHSVFSETEIRRSILGSISVEVSQKHLAWLSFIHEGAVRGVFHNNIVNEQQLERLSSIGIVASQQLANGLHYITSPTSGEYGGRP